MVCKLHNDEADLCNSHIIPDFVYRWMKETGPGRFRQSGSKNKPQEDGVKTKMLCKKCEIKFSAYEKWFSENVFYPYLKDNTFIVKNEPQLQYFIISVLWRILALFKDDGNEYNFKKELDEAENEWRNFLLDARPLKKYINQHFILIDSSYWIDKKSDLYFSRAVDIEIGESDEVCFIYAKFSRFILVGEIIGFRSEDFKNTNISLENVFRNTNQMIGIGDFFSSRISNTTLYEDLSENQKIKNDAYYKDKLEGMKDTDYVKILKKY